MDARPSVSTPLGACMRASFAKQIVWCSSLGSPFTAEPLTLLDEDGAADGVTARLLAGGPGDPLRLAGALHALVLGGAAPKLAAYYPPNGVRDPDRWRRAMLDALATHDVEAPRFLAFSPQTNEVGRSAVLVGGFHHVARRGGLPLRLLEIGASAGLNAIWGIGPAHRHRR